MSSTSVAQGEVVPLAVRVIPASSDYDEFTIDLSKSRIDIQNSIGSSITPHGELSLDEDNKTVMYSWDTSKYNVGSYVITFWVSVKYKENEFLIKSDTIAKAIKQVSILN